MLRRLPLLRTAGVLLAGAYAVHEARLLAVGHDAAGHAAGPGHDYIQTVELVLGVVAALVLAQLLLSLRRASHGAAEAEAPSFRALWAQLTAALLGIHVAQELLEAVVTGAGASAAVAGSGMLVASVAASVIGAMGAALLRGFQRLTLVIARARRDTPPQTVTGTTTSPRHHRAAATPRLAPLARLCAERAPPALA